MTNDGELLIGRPLFPAEYGKLGGPDETLPWSFVEERLVAALNYWLSTVGPGQRPHARPVDGVWVDGALCFGGSPETRWVRNLTQSAAVSVHLNSDTEVVILEGKAEQVTDPDHPLAKASTEASVRKYPQYFSGDTSSTFEPFWMVRPSTIYAWTLEGFPRLATKWTRGRA